MGMTGVVLVTIVDAFSTASAINATLFSTARLMEDVAGKKELPAILEHENSRKIPDYAVILLGAVSIILSVTGSSWSFSQPA